MKPLPVTRIAQTLAVLATLVIASSAGAATVRNVSTFATGAAVNATRPDSISLGDRSVWVSYTNGADSTGLSGSSTVVQYDFSGNVVHSYSIAGYVDGLKLDPQTGLVWALQNQDGNSTLMLINPQSGITPNSPISYASPSSARGYDDVVFPGDRVFLSYTNPSAPTDPTIQMLQKGTNPLAVTPVLRMGATGTDLATGLADQPTSQNDPDSLKLTPSGALMLTSGDDGQFIFVEHPATARQSVSFLTLLDPSTGLPVSGLDDAIFATAEKGTFFLADTKNNRVLKIEADDLPFGSLYACIGSLNALAAVDMATGVATPLVGSLNGPHGLAFRPQQD